MQVKSKRGSVLILVLWALGLLTVFSLYLGINVRQRLTFLDRIETRSCLYPAAEAGVKRAIAELANIDNEASFIALKDSWSNNPEIFYNILMEDVFFSVGYQYEPDDFSECGSALNEASPRMFGAQDAASRLNINTADYAEIKALIVEAAQVEDYTADIIASSIVDWRDKDNLSLPNGAEDAYYRSLPVSYGSKDAPFEALEELCYVRDMNQEIFSRIKPYITIFGSGSININTASRRVLSALNLGTEVTDKIIAYRCGQDAQAGTNDDGIFTDVSSITAQLSQAYSLSPSELAQLSNVVAAGKLSVYSDVFIVESVAYSKKSEAKCRVSCVFEKNFDLDSKKAGWILSWDTEYFI
ncbi:MAG: hypothetical protein ABII75_05720 [Candidatus Omnitrophota bacterium]